ncbi:hypothetical protein PRZ48_013210 [Zasmidium cellare]|uniref:DNA replication factor Cdt1 C-terminal domain-containing protein n=1 Tax=Zasmidium cellare TaxID=395010 RepID=A0ABR0E3F3_ZASCE|nr:hypothetical protein PRZ48_013210 [Zasmidium cellare]
MARPGDEATARKSLVVKLKVTSYFKSNIAGTHIDSRETADNLSPQQPATKRKRVPVEDRMDIDNAVEGGKAGVDEGAEGDADAEADVDENADDDANEDAMSDDESIDAWPLKKYRKFNSLLHSGKTNDDLLELPPKDIKGVTLLQLRLEYTMQGLLDAYNTRHQDQTLHLSTVKKAFSSAFNHTADLNNVSIEDLKKFYNTVTQGSKTRKSRGKLEVASQPTGIVKGSLRPVRTARNATPAVPSPNAREEVVRNKRSLRPMRAARNATTAVPNAREETTNTKEQTISTSEERKMARKEKVPRKKKAKTETVGALDEPEPARPLSEDEIAGMERLSALLAAGADIPELNFHHAIVKTVSEKRDFDRLTTKQLREIDHVGRVYTSEQIALSINTLITDCATEEDIRELVEKTRKEMVLPGYGNDGYNKGYDMYLPAEKL